MFGSMMQLLGMVVPPQHQREFFIQLSIYVSRTTSVAMRRAAYRSMWGLISRSITTAVVQAARGFVSAALAAAGVGFSLVNKVLAGIASFLAGTGGAVVLIILVAAILCALIWMVSTWLNESRQQRQRQQNLELERNTRKLFSSDERPLDYAVLVNKPFVGPIEVIRTGTVPAGCAVPAYA